MFKDCVIKIFNDMIKNRLIGKSSSVLCICATSAEKETFQCLGFENVVISNLDEVKDAALYHPYSYEKQNAMDLTYPNESFDFVFVSAGLHHCSSPHKALTEEALTDLPIRARLRGIARSKCWQARGGHI